MKIAFATLYDLHDVRRGSGSYHFIARELERQGQIVEYVGPLEIRSGLATRLLRKISRSQGRKYTTYQDFWTAQDLGFQVAEKLAYKDIDCLLTNDYGIAAYTRTKKPVVLYTDAIFPRDYAANIHPWLDNLSKISILFSQWVTWRGLMRADLCIFPSHWTFEQASSYSPIIARKSHVIPFGANLSDPASESASRRGLVDFAKKNRIDLLFVGTDWELKGGAIALGVAEKLNLQGVPALLHVAGRMPESLIRHKNIQFHGYLDKTNPTDFERLNQLYRSCDVFILPSKAEGFGIVFAEAAAFGLPSLACYTSGVTGAIAQGKSGIMLPLESPDPVSQFTAIICEWLHNPEQYKEMSRNARCYYQTTLNWSVAISAVLEKIRSLGHKAAAH